MTKNERNLKKHLRDLITANRIALVAIDKAMERGSNQQRGEMIAKITNFMELNTDIAARFGMGEKFKGEK